ncbi:MAG: hypothetical protein ABSA74_03505 [Candidatus Staskawiczbacteria bacterium]|jgi:hypothetical protein
MNQKIFLLTIFFAVMALVPLGKASAIDTYVGIQLTAASTSNVCQNTCAYNGGTCNGFTCVGSFGYCCESDSNWCLQGGDLDNPGARLFVGNGCTVNNTGTSSSCPGFNILANPPAAGTAVPVCSGGAVNTLWSGLVSLTPNSSYVLAIWSDSYCPGVMSDLTGGTCWVVSSASNQNCIQTCNSYGMVPDYTNGSTSLTTADCNNQGFQKDSSNSGTNLVNCTVISNLRSSQTGSPCSSCTPVSSAGYNYYDTSGNCWYTTYSGYSICAAPGASNLTRACECQFNSNSNTFYFGFTTPSSF